MPGSRQYGSPRDLRSVPVSGDKPNASRYGERTRDSNEPKPEKENPSPSSRVVEQFHRNADTDVRRESIHHTLGPTQGQSSPGDHNHDGGTSRQILDGYILTGSKANPATMWPSIIQCLVRLGAKDSTTA